MKSVRELNHLHIDSPIHKGFPKTSVSKFTQPGGLKASVRVPVDPVQYVQPSVHAQQEDIVSRKVVNVLCPLQ